MNRGTGSQTGRPNPWVRAYPPSVMRAGQAVAATRMHRHCTAARGNTPHGTWSMDWQKDSMDGAEDGASRTSPSPNYGRKESDW